MLIEQEVNAIYVQYNALYCFYFYHTWYVLSYILNLVIMVLVNVTHYL